MKFAIAIGVLILAGVAVDAQQIKSAYKTFRFGPRQVGITCVDGSMPTVWKPESKLENVIFLSCPMFNVQ
jgi:formate-dependent nitrite reductase cytochrome c552 subunit